jgi:hypothetical protein
VDADSAVVSSYGCENGLENRFRVAIYGDMESAEHAKTRLLIMIDQIVCLIPSLLLIAFSVGGFLDYAEWKYIVPVIANLGPVETSR